MNVVALIMAGFSVLGGLDCILGNRFGIGKEFERGMQMLGTLALAMIGMLVIAPTIAELLQPALCAMAKVVPIDPSIVTASLFANDMGGAPLSEQIAQDPSLGSFHGLVVASMMGATVSFTIPFALRTVAEEMRREMLIGLLCGVVTIPVGCLIGGLIAGVAWQSLLINLCPLAIFAAIIALGLLKFPDACVKIFHVVGILIKILITVGLIIGIFQSVTGIVFLKSAESYENAGVVILGVAAVMTGAFPMVHLLSRLLRKPLSFLGNRLGIGEIGMTGFLATLATSVTTFEMMKQMNRRAVVLNSAFAVSAAFVLADHLAYTLAYRGEYLPAVMVGKLIAGALAVLIALPISARIAKKTSDGETT